MFWKNFMLKKLSSKMFVNIFYALKKIYICNSEWNSSKMFVNMFYILKGNLNW